jgi:hypothetical protein
VAGKNKVPQATTAAWFFGGFCFFGSFLMPGRERAMYGKNRQLFILRCRVCHRWIAVRADPDDLRRHYYDGVYVQRTFPYLPPELRELFISRTCSDCWAVLCPDPIANWIQYN